MNTYPGPRFVAAIVAVSLAFIPYASAQEEDAPQAPEESTEDAEAEDDVTDPEAEADPSSEDEAAPEPAPETETETDAEAEAPPPTPATTELDANEEVEVITVTTQKREQSITDVPLSVGVVNGTFLEENGIYDLDDAAEYIPGFQLQLQQINTPSFVIRGITSDVGDPEAEPNVSVFFDGIPGSRSAGAAIELFDLERVEVAKGPQGTLFSRGASNGAVNFIFRKPEFEKYAEAAIQYGNYQNQRVQLVVNSPLGDTDRAAVRLGLVYHDREGFVESANEEDVTYNGKDTLHLRGSIRWDPIDDLVVNFISYFQVDTPENTAFKTMVPALAQLDPFTDYTGNPDTDPVDGFAPAAQTPGLSLSRRVSGFTGLIDWDLNDTFRISSTSGYRRVESDEVFDIDGISLPLLQGDESTDSEVLFQEFRFTWTPDLPFSMFGGVSFYQEEASLDRRVLFDQDPLFNNVLPLIAGQPLPATIAGLGQITEQTITQNTTTSYSAFLDGTLEIIEDLLAITGGARITEDQKEYSYAAPTAGDGSALTLAFSNLNLLGGALGGSIPDLIGFLESIPQNPFSPGNATLSNGSTGLLDLLGVPAALVPPNLETNALDGTTAGQTLVTDTVFQYIEPRAVLEVRPLDGMLIYASFARGIRSGGLDINPRAGVNEADYRRRIKKESVQSYEVGIKGTTDLGVARFTGEAAAYIYDYKNFQTFLFLDGQSVILNAGDASAQGFEAAANFAFDGGFSVFGNVAYLDGGIDTGSSADVLGNEISLEGNEFRLTPEINASGGVSYQLALTNDLIANASLLGSYRGDFFFNPENERAGDLGGVPQDLAQEAYFLMNATLGFRYQEIYGLTFRGENVLDEEYFVDLGNTGRALGTPTSIRGQPRFLTVTLDARF